MLAIREQLHDRTHRALPVEATDVQDHLGTLGGADRDASPSSEMMKRGGTKVPHRQSSIVHAPGGPWTVDLNHPLPQDRRPRHLGLSASPCGSEYFAKRLG